VGQPVAVVPKPSTRPGLLRFEANRNLTGMGHERFTSAEDAVGDRPAAKLARRFFDTGHVDAVHVYMNMVTVDMRAGHDGEALQKELEDLYLYYYEGFVPPPLEVPVEEAPPAPSASPVAGGGDAPADPALSKVPAHLLERSRAARARLAAKG
jgi:hypothetical protein